MLTAITTQRQSAARPSGARPQPEAHTAECAEGCRCPQCIKAAAAEAGAPERKPWHELTPAQAARKRRKGLCQRYGCPCKAGSHKAYCPKHHHQALKARDVVSYMYSYKKQRAKARGIDWSLTLDEFRAFCEANGYHRKSGRFGRAASIDRIDPTQGYHIGNIRQISYSANSRKGATTDKAAHRQDWGAAPDD